MNITRQLFITTALFAAASAACAQATITHDKALAGSVTPGDSAGYPITISQPGSYILKSNLVVPFGQRGIDIAAPNVTLDLNGFAIIGAGTCSQDNSTRIVTCASASNTGIFIGNEGLGAVVRNGAVKGFDTGIFATNASLEDLYVSNSGSVGIYADNGMAYVTAIRRVRVDLSGIYGIGIDRGSVEASHVARSGKTGIISTGARALVSDSTARLSRVYGIADATVRGTLTEANGTDTSAVISMGGNSRSGTIY